MRRQDKKSRVLVVRRACVASVTLGIVCGWIVPAAQAQPFPAAGDDTSNSKGIFKVTLSPAFGGGTTVIKVSGPFCVARSDPKLISIPPCRTF